MTNLTAICDEIFENLNLEVVYGFSPEDSEEMDGMVVYYGEDGEAVFVKPSGQHGEIVD